MNRRHFLKTVGIGTALGFGESKTILAEPTQTKFSPELKSRFGYLEKDLGKKFFDAILNLPSVPSEKERRKLLSINNLRHFSNTRLANVQLMGIPLPVKTVKEIIKITVPEECLFDITKISYDQGYNGLLGSDTGQGKIVFGRYIKMLDTRGLIGGFIHEVGHFLGPTANKALTLTERLKHTHLLVQRIKSGKFDTRYFPYEQKELCRQLDEYSTNMMREFLTDGFAYMPEEDAETVRFVLQKMIPNLNDAADQALAAQRTIISQDKTRVD